MNTIESSKRFQDLIVLENDESSYLFNKIFCDKTWGERSLSKKKFKLLKRIEPEIRKILKENEKVDYISYGVDVSFAESFFIGWLMYYINRKAMIFTNERILLLQVSSRNKPKDMRYELRYGDIDKVSRMPIRLAQVHLIPQGREIANLATTG